MPGVAHSGAAYDSGRVVHAMKAPSAAGMPTLRVAKCASLRRVGRGPGVPKAAPDCPPLFRREKQGVSEIVPGTTRDNSGGNVTDETAVPTVEGRRTDPMASLRDDS